MNIIISDHWFAVTGGRLAESVVWAFGGWVGGQELRLQANLSKISNIFIYLRFALTSLVFLV
jgi:hypothetical protein